MSRQTFRKPHHLCLRRDIEALFRKGRPSAVAFPLRVVWQEVEDACPQPYKVLVSVSKRHLRHAADRNRAKRQVRESFRLNQQLLAVKEGHTLHLAFLWISETLQPTQKVQYAVVRLMEKINHASEHKA